MKYIGKQVIGELGEIGKKVGGESIKAPVDIAGTALESLGGKTGSKTQGGLTPDKGDSGAGGDTGPWTEIDHTHEEEKKRMLARAALRQLAGSGVIKEPSVWEKMEKEKEEKREAVDQVKERSRNTVPYIKGKTKRGSAFSHKAMRKKQTGMETKINIKAG